MVAHHFARRCDCAETETPFASIVAGVTAGASLDLIGHEIVPVFAEPMVSLRRFQALAHHEAGHAVAGVLAGRNVAFVTIDGHPACGFTRSNAGDIWSAIGSLAGPAAETLEHRHEHRRPDDVWRSHIEAVATGAPPACDGCKAAGAAIRTLGMTDHQALTGWLRRREVDAYSLLRERPVWTAVRVVSEELREVGTLPGSRVEEIVASCVPNGLRAAIREEIENVDDR